MLTKPSRSAFTSRFPVTDLNNGDSSASALTSLPADSQLHRISLLFADSYKSLLFKVRVRVTLRLAVYRQSVLLGVKPLENHDQRFIFATEPLRS
jgi:hypothetical protein